MEKGDPIKRLVAAVQWLRTMADNLRSMMSSKSTSNERSEQYFDSLTKEKL